MEPIREHPQWQKQHAYPLWGSSFSYLWADPPVYRIYTVVFLSPVNTGSLWIIKSCIADSEIKFLINAILKLHNVSCYGRSALCTISCAQRRYDFSLCKVMFLACCLECAHCWHEAQLALLWLTLASPRLFSLAQHLHLALNRLQDANVHACLDMSNFS